MGILKNVCESTRSNISYANLLSNRIDKKCVIVFFYYGIHCKDIVNYLSDSIISRFLKIKIIEVLVPYISEKKLLNKLENTLENSIIEQYIHNHRSPLSKAFDLAHCASSTITGL